MSARHLFAACLFGLASTTALIPAPGFARAAPESFAPLVDPLLPAVVNIYTTQKMKAPGAGVGAPFGGVPGDPNLGRFRQFFEQFGMQPMPQGGAEDGASEIEQEVTSLGSGFIIDPAGYIVTNAHVIADAAEINVKLHDNTELKAKLIGKDVKTDLALLKVESKTPLPFVKFGDSDAGRVGDWVIAIGNPFGLGGSVSAGIISARERSINAGPFDDFIQTDAAINRGNSGGPLFNTEGQVIGINSAIFSPSGGNIGIGFAVPSAMAQPILKQLRESGHVSRGWLGVKIQEVNAQIAESVGLDKARGALVLDVVAGSPGAKAGIKTGDVILTFDGKAIGAMRSLPRIVAESGIGKSVPVEIWRDGKKQSLSATIQILKEEDEAAAKPAQSKSDKSAPQGEQLLGMRLSRVSDALRTRYQIAADVDGLVVIDITPGSAVLKEGLRPGDVLLQLQQTPLKSTDILRKGLEQAAKSGRNFALLRVWRGGDSLFVTVPTK